MARTPRKDHRLLVYRSNLGEIKTLRQWLEFVNRNNAMIATNSEEDKIRIVSGPILQEKVLRELTEYNPFKVK